MECIRPFAGTPIILEHGLRNQMRREYLPAVRVPRNDKVYAPLCFLQGIRLMIEHKDRLDRSAPSMSVDNSARS